MGSKNKIPVEISLDLYSQIKKRIESHQTTLESVEEYVEFALKEALKKEAETLVYSEEEEKKIEKHLNDLGYI